MNFDDLIPAGKSTGAKQPGIGFDDIVPKDPGYLGDIGRGLISGATVQLPKMAGQALKFFGADGVGDSLIAGAAARDTPDIQESAVGQAHDSPYSIRGNVHEAATNFVPSIGPGLAGAAIGAGIGAPFGGVGALPGAGIGYIAGSIASLPMFYGSQAQESYEAVKKHQLEIGTPEAEAESIARKTGHVEGAIEAGGELLSDVIPFAKIVKPLAKVGTKAAGSAVKSVFFPGIKTAAKTTAGVVGGEVATEMAQQAGEDQARKSIGGTGEGATWAETEKVIMPTALMSIIPGMAGAGARHVQAKNVRAALESADTDPAARAKILDGALASMQGASPEAAADFEMYAKDQIKAGKPINLSDDSFYADYVLNSTKSPVQQSEPAIQAAATEGAPAIITDDRANSMVDQMSTEADQNAQAVRDAAMRTPKPGAELDPISQSDLQNRLMAAEQAAQAEEAARGAALDAQNEQDAVTLKAAETVQSLGNGPISSAVKAGIPGGGVTTEALAGIQPISPEEQKAQAEQQKAQQSTRARADASKSAKNLTSATEGSAKAVLDEARQALDAGDTEAGLKLAKHGAALQKHADQLKEAEAKKAEAKPAKQMPFTEVGAKARAAELKKRDGKEYDVVPHETAKGKFAVVPAAKQKEVAQPAGKVSSTALDTASQKPASTPTALVGNSTGAASKAKEAGEAQPAVSSSERDKAISAYEEAYKKHYPSHAADIKDFPKMAGGFADAVVNKDTNYLHRVTANGLNKAQVAAFQKVTGVKMPGTQSGMRAAIDQWAGITPEKRAEIDRARETAQDAQIAAKDKARRSEKAASQRITVKGAQTTGKAFIDEQIAKGFDRVEGVKKGVATKYYLVNKEGLNWDLPNRTLYEYAKDAVADKEASNATNLVSDQPSPTKDNGKPADDGVATPAPTKAVQKASEGVAVKPVQDDNRGVKSEGEVSGAGQNKTGSDGQRGSQENSGNPQEAPSQTGQKRDAALEPGNAKLDEPASGSAVTKAPEKSGVSSPTSSPKKINKLAEGRAAFLAKKEAQASARVAEQKAAETPADPSAITLGTYGVMPSKNNSALTLRPQGKKFALYQGANEAIDGDTGEPITYKSADAAIADLKEEMKRSPRRFLSTRQRVYFAQEKTATNEPLASRSSPTPTTLQIVKIDGSDTPRLFNRDIIMRTGRPQTAPEGFQRFALDLHDSQGLVEYIKTLPSERAFAKSKVGEILLDFKDGKPVALWNLQLYQSRRGQGWGEKIVGSLMSLGNPIVIKDIQPAANGFWEKMGAKWPHSAIDFQEATLYPEQYENRRSTQEGSATDPRASESRAAAQPARAESGPESGRNNDRRTSEDERARSEKELIRLVKNLEGQLNAGLSVSVVERIVASTGVQAKVLKDDSQLPPQLRTWLRSHNLEGGIDGLFDPTTGQAYVIASRVPNEAAAIAVALHEATHRGLRRMFGLQMIPALNAIHDANANVQKTTAEYMQKHGMSKLEAVEEVLADMASRAEAKNLTGWDKIVQIVKAWLVKRGVTLKLSDDQIEMIVSGATKLGKAGPDAHAAEGAQPMASRVLDAAKAAAAKVDGMTSGKGIYHAGHLNDTQRATIEKIFGKPLTFTERIRKTYANAGAKIIQGLFDQYAPLKELGFREYMLARMAKSSDGTLEATLKYGIPKLKDGIFDIDTSEKGFIERLQSLQGEQDLWAAWMAGQRAAKLKEAGKENLFSDADIAVFKTLNEGKMKDGRSRAEAYFNASVDLNKFNKAVLDIAEARGIIDPESRKVWESSVYIPFYRNMEDGTSGPSIKSGLVNQHAFKKLKGGTAQLNQDLLANILQNWAHLLSASAKNAAAKAALDKAEELGVAYQVPTTTKGAVRYLENGVEKHFNVEDPFILDAISSMESAGLPTWAKPLGKFKHILTMGVTANPAFKIRNLIRDSLQAIATSDLSYNPYTNVKAGLNATKQGSKTYIDMLANGGIIRFGAMLDGNTAGHTRRLIAAGVKDSSILDTKEKVAAFAQTIWDGYNELGDRSENANRGALYEKLIAEGVDPLEAAFHSRDLMDFSMSGSWGAVRFLTQVVPFMNARLQGLYKLGRAAKQDPARMGYVAGAVSLASIALLLGYKDDDDWKKREDWDRDSYWWFKVGGTAWRIPKPFEVGAIGTIAERTLELAISDEMTGKRFADRMANIVSSTFAMSPVPQLFKPMLDVYANKDAFTGRPIENLAMERLRPEDRFLGSTSETARLLGKIGLPDPVMVAQGKYGPLSPLQIDSLIRGYFGWVGTSITSAIDVMAKPALGRPTRPAMQMRDIFLAGNFVEGLPTGSSRYVSQLYEQAKEIEQAYASYHAALKSGDTARAKEIYDDEGKKIAKYRTVEHIKRMESKISQQIKKIEESDATSDEKRVRIDLLAARRDQMARSIRN